MQMLDDLDQLRAADKSGFLARLYDLPGSYEGPDGLRSEPYGAIGFGEAANLPLLLGSWFDAKVVVGGTQFLLAGGFDHGELAPLKLSSELAGAGVVVAGYAAHEPDFEIARGPLSLYQYACYLAYATGHDQVLTQAEEAMLQLRTRLAPATGTAENPAKTLAWTLWNRIALFIAGREAAGLPQQLQHVFARTGKSLAVTAGEHPLEFAAGAFETRKELGDEVIAVVVGPEDEEMRLAREVLGTRVSQVEQLDLPGLPIHDPGGRALVLWYYAMHVAAYLALLHGHSPEDNEVYEKLVGAAHG